MEVTTVSVIRFNPGNVFRDQITLVFGSRRIAEASVDVTYSKVNRQDEVGPYDRVYRHEDGMVECVSIETHEILTSVDHF